VNEADIGDIAAGNPVTFTVDAYPNRTFRGVVEQVRLAATNIQNVVTYTVIITSVNEDRRLFPGMTANATIETGIREDVLKVPNEALRFRPRDGGRSSGSDSGSRSGERLQRMIEQASLSIGLTDEQKSALQDRMRKVMQELRPTGGLLQQVRPRESGERVAQSFEKELSAIVTEAQRDAFETWKRERESTKNVTVYVLDAHGKPEPRFVRAGLADETGTEIVGGTLKEGEAVILRAREAAGT
jgi:HlyD family secretion protein